MPFNFVTLFPPVFPIRFYAEEDNTNPDFTFVQFDQKAQAETPMPWQTNIPYTQKVTLTDEIAVQIHTQVGDPGDPSSTELYIYDSNENLIATIPQSDLVHFKGRQEIAGNTYTDPESGVITDLASYLYVFSLAEFPLLIPPPIVGGPWTSEPLNGIYTIRVKNYSGTSEFGSLYYRSEPILVYPVHPNTMLVTAKNEKNRIDQDFVISGWNGDYIPEPTIRVEGHIEQYVSRGYLSGYLGQEYLVEIDRAQNFRTFKFVLGSVDKGVPPYMLDKLKEMLTCDLFTLDGKAFIYDLDGNESSGISDMWDVEDTITSPMMWAEFPIRERYNRAYANFVTVPYTILELWRSPRYETLTPLVFIPYFIMPFYWVSGSTVVSIPGKALYSIAEEEAFIAYLQSILPAPLAGTYILDSNDYYAYQSEAGESPTLPVAADLLTVYASVDFEMPLVTPGVVIVDSFRIRTNPGTKIAFDWATGNDDYSIYATSSSIVYFPSFGYTPPVASTVSVNIFHNDILQSFRADDPVSSTAKLKAIYNDMPAGLNQFVIANVTNYALPALVKITRCDSIEILSITNTNITVFTPDFLSVNYPLLKIIRLNNNELTQPMVDDAFNKFVANTPVRVTGTIEIFDTQLQTPLAPPTALSATARNALNTDGWTVIHD